MTPVITIILAALAAFIAFAAAIWFVLRRSIDIDLADWNRERDN